MKQKIILCLMMLMGLSAYAQAQTELRGRLVNSATNEPVSGVVVTLRGHDTFMTTSSEGIFSFKKANPGDDVLAISGRDVVAKELSISIVKDEITDLGDISLVVNDVVENMAMVNAVDDSFLNEEGTNQEITPMMVVSNDLYLKKTGYQLSQFRFKVRGYENRYQERFINGVAFNDQNRGGFNYASVGALNDITRNGDAANFFNPSTFSFGAIGGSENIDMRAGTFAKGGKLTMSYTNRNYYLRGMASYSTGMMDDGYAFTVALGGRYSDEGQVDGTFYRNVALALGMEKQWNNGKHSLSVNLFASPVERGQQHATTDEVYDLVGDNQYNPDWGYQNGKRRNSRVVKAWDPTAVISHVWKINRKINLTTGIATHYARYGNTALNWYKGPDPRPDYYRKLPSFQEDPVERARKTELWRNGGRAAVQVNWDDMYQRNYEERMKGGAALYMLEERRSDLFETSLNSTINIDLTDNIKVTGGIGLRTSESKQFKTVKDMMGAEHVLDIDKFAERDFEIGDPEISKQSDLNHPNRKVYKGDRFGYDFRFNINSANAWFQEEIKTQPVDINFGFKFQYTDFRRDGNMKNGRFPESSYGKGEIHRFYDFGAKIGATYKINGRHYITGNVNFNTEAPLPNDAYVAPRVTDKTVKLKNGKIFSADLSYVFSSPKFDGRVTLFQTNFFDMMRKNSYYDDTQKTFLHHVLTGMEKTHRGVEVGLSYTLDDHWSFDLAGTIAEYYYSNNPTGTMISENGKVDDTKNVTGEGETVVYKDYYVGGTPQMAGTLGINYFNNFWFLNMSINGFARNYVDIAPIRRVASNYQHLNLDNPTDFNAMKILTNQERYGSGYTVDFSVGKIFYLRNNQSVNFNLAFNNILNRKDIKTGGYEQGRLQTKYPERFGSKYFYMQGFNCFLNASYKF